MKRIFTLGALLCANFLFAQGIANYNFDGKLGNEGSLSASYVQLGLSASEITRGPGLTAELQANTFNSKGFTNSIDVDLTDYIQFTITPSVGFETKILSFTIIGSRNNNGPKKLVVRTSLDDFSANASNIVEVPTSVEQFSINIDDIITKKPVTFRIYGYNAQNSGNSTFAIGGVNGPDLVIEGGAVAITLPVNFTSFNAKKEGTSTKLTWNVAQQDNVSHYEVERSANGASFTKIGEVKALDVTSYNFTDVQPAQGTVQYRIKNVDFDGKFKYSTVVTMKNGTAAIELKAFPLPARNSITVQHNTAAAQAQIRISSQDGRLLKTVRPGVGAMQTQVDLSSFTSGLYILNFDNGNGVVETIKLVKQ